MPEIHNELDQSLYDSIVAHLSKIGAYIPASFKKGGGTKQGLIDHYRLDPLYSIFGLDSPEYVAAAAGGSTVTSIHRKLGDVYESSVKMIFMHSLELTPEQITHRTPIQSGDKAIFRSADVCLHLADLRLDARKRIRAYAKAELRRLTPNPKFKLEGVGMEVRHCYQTGDSKRTQADEAMARDFYLNGILPIMPLFCNQSNAEIVRRYRTVWVIKEGMESYDMIRAFSGYDFFAFLNRNRDDFRRPVLTMLRTLTA